MSTSNKHTKDMLFKQYTTSQDYRHHELKKDGWKRPEPQRKVKTIIYQPLKHMETMFPLKSQVSFCLFHKPKSATEDYPQKITKEDLKIKNTPELIANRPRVMMTPQVCIDEIKDMDLRDKLLQNTYVSTAHKAAFKVPLDDNVAPLPGKYSRTNAVYLEPSREPKVSPEWRMESCAWDRRQLRSFVDPDREFWKSHDFYKNCIACAESAHWAHHQRTKRMLK